MSVPVVARPPCLVYAETPRQKRVRFCAEHPVTKVMDVTHKYPSNYFYTRAEMDRFRREARAERMGSADSPVQRAFDLASSSLFIVVLLIVGLITAMIACLPMLLLVKVWSIFFSSSSHIDVDSSIRPYSPSLDLEASSFTERILLNFLGESSLSCTNKKVTPL